MLGLSALEAALRISRVDYATLVRDVHAGDELRLQRPETAGHQHQILDIEATDAALRRAGSSDVFVARGGSASADALDVGVG